MKYPQNQFDKLVNILYRLSNYADLETINYSHLHYLAYQQVSEGQTHNAIVVCNDNTIMRQFQADKEGVQVYKRLCEIDNTFELYPNDTNDNHIKTAIKRALNEINPK